MSVFRLVRIVGTAGVIVAFPLVMAMAQAQSAPPSPTSPPGATKTESSVPPTTSPTTAADPTTAAEKKAAAPAAAGNLVGLAVKSLDGTNLGTVRSVMTEPDGKTAISIKVGGFLGFGGHMVAIPNAKFNRVGDTVQVNMTADEVNKLPQAKKQS